MQTLDEVDQRAIFPQMIWAVAVFFAVLGAALMAGPSFANFLIYLAMVLLMGLGLRQIEKSKRLKDEKQDND